MKPSLHKDLKYLNHTKGKKGSGKFKCIKIGKQATLSCKSSSFHKTKRRPQIIFIEIKNFIIKCSTYFVMQCKESTTYNTL